MPRRPVTSYRLHKASGQATVWVTLGPGRHRPTEAEPAVSCTIAFSLVAPERPQTWDFQTQVGLERGFLRQKRRFRQFLVCLSSISVKVGSFGIFHVFTVPRCGTRRIRSSKSVHRGGLRYG